MGVIDTSKWISPSGNGTATGVPGGMGGPPGVGQQSFIPNNLASNQNPVKIIPNTANSSGANTPANTDWPLNQTLFGNNNRVFILSILTIII